MILNRGVSISSDLIFECQKRTINITFIDKQSDIHVSFDNENSIRDPGVIKNQVMAAVSEKGSGLAKCFVSCKLGNQRAILKYFQRSHSEAPAPVKKTLEHSIEKVEEMMKNVQKLQTEAGEILKKALFILEAHGARHYFKSLTCLIPEEIGFSGRVQKDPPDQFNMALNYVYGILKGLVSNCINRAGLSKYIAFMHTDEPGRTSLTFDIMDEFRQAACDLPLISFFRKGGRIELDENRKISLKSRKELAAIFFSKLNGVFNYNGQETCMAEIVEEKIGEIRSVLLNEGSHRPFIMKW